MFLAQVEAGIKTIDHVASQNDRWAFFASLGILLLFGYFVLRHFMLLSMKQNQEHRETINLHASEMRTINREMTAALVKNTDVLDRCLKELEKRK